MFEVDSSTSAIRRERHFDFGDEIGIVRKFGRELPDEDEARRRLPHRYLADFALGPVDVEFVPAAAGTRLDNGPVEVGGTDLVSLRPPTADSVGERIEGMFRRGVDLDGLANRSRSDLSAHSFSFVVLFSTSAAKAASAPSQNWSSQARIAPSPFGSM